MTVYGDAVILPGSVAAFVRGIVPVIAVPAGLVGVIVYMTKGILGRPAQERVTPSTAVVLPTRLLILYGTGSSNAKSALFSGVIKSIFNGVELPLPLTAVRVAEYTVLSERPVRV